jgi:hypothetical protein
MICSFKAFASSLQLGLGGLTPHFSASKKNYCNQWNNTGVIANKSYYLRVMFERLGVSYLQGNDSICSEIEGLFLHYRFSDDGWWDTGLILGGYAYNQKNWDEHAISTPSSIEAPQPVSGKYFGRDIVPVLAVDVGVRILQRDNWALRINNIFTPIIFNHSVAWEYFFH